MIESLKMFTFTLNSIFSLNTLISKGIPEKHELPRFFCPNMSYPVF